MTRGDGDGSSLTPSPQNYPPRAFARLVEADGGLVTVDGGDVAIAGLEVEDAVALLRCFRLGVERDGSDDRFGRVLLEFGVAAQLVDGAWRGQALAAIALPILGGEFQHLGGVLHRLIDGVARGDHARQIGKRDAVATVGILVDQGDVVGHRSVLRPAGLLVDAADGAWRQVALRMRHDHHQALRRMYVLVVRTLHRLQFEAVLEQPANDITAVAEH